MDPITGIGLVASVVQLISTTADLVRYINKVKDGSTDRRRLALECAGLIGFLTEFRYEIEDLDLQDPRLKGMQALAQEGSPLEQLAQALQTIAEKLKPAGRIRRCLKAFIWPLQKEDIDDVLSKMERLKSLIALYRQGDQLFVCTRTAPALASRH